LTQPDDGAQLVAEAEDLLRGHALARRLAELLGQELLGPAQELFGSDRAIPWIVSTLRSTAELLEHVGDAGRFEA
jgi:hypothetical protein